MNQILVEAFQKGRFPFFYASTFRGFTSISDSDVLKAANRMIDSFSNIASPKRMAANTPKSESWYEFYAMYAEDFVRGVFERIPLRPHSMVLDPWNGTGTTTTIAFERQHRSIGIDINPVMAIIAKSRIIPNKEREAIAHIRWKPRARHEPAVADTDPLLTWFAPSAVRTFRELQQRIGPWTGEIAPKECLLYVALFRTIRTFLQPFRTTNPTWCKRPETLLSRLRPQREKIYAAFLHNVRHLANVPPRTYDNETACWLPNIQVKSSCSLNLPDESVDLVVTSPPYCTRIDYAKTTLPELSLLGCDCNFIRSLRDSTLGTPTISPEIKQNNDNFGSYVKQLLRKIEQHPSKSSRSYYLKTYQQYFSGLSQALNEVARVVKSTAHAVFVVQDSYYKDIHVDLARAYEEMLEDRNFCLREKVEFSTRTMAALSRYRALYRDQLTAKETVLVFQKKLK